MKTRFAFPPNHGRGRPTRAGLTRIEVVTVLAMLGVLACLLQPALAHDASRGLRALCLHRLAQFGRALQMYASDSREWLPPNMDDSNLNPYGNWVGGNVAPGGAHEYNPDVLRDPTRSLLFAYLNGDVEVFRCPAETRRGRYQGTDPALLGKYVGNARSVALNGAVGTKANFSGRAPVDGPWLDGIHSHTANKIWRCYAKISDFGDPGPGQLITILEEDPFSINDGSFSFVGPSEQQNYKLIDWPSTLHDMAGAVSFGDGHAEIHTWQDPRTQVINGNVALSTQPGNQDIRWLSTHISVLVGP